jgi:D-arabinose 1-dehydrogenase-like Zn-dependent alcohol dehydrogenase
MDELERAIALAAEGRVQMIVDRVSSLQDANDAFQAPEAGEVLGRCVVDVAGE